MRGTQLGGAERVFRRAVAESLKISSRDSNRLLVDVLEEHEFGFEFDDDPQDFWPEVLCNPSSTARIRKRLAREARSNEIHDATPRAAIEGS